MKDKISTREKIRNAFVSKKDEFYTFLADIENEIENYKEHLVGKIIYCNCDDYRSSSFCTYFKNNFKRLKIKKLLATSYNKNGGDYYEYSGTDDVIKKELKGDGDFRSVECVEILKKSDVVITNPPFSLFRDFINIVVKNGKDFIIIGNINAIAYKNIFPLVVNNKIRLGYNTSGSIGMRFKIPSHYKQPDYYTSLINHKGKFVFVTSIWFTTLKVIKNRDLDKFLNIYSVHNFSKYANYDAINVDRSIDIPMDYEGEMGVPLSFMHKYDPSIWEITGIGKDFVYKPLNLSSKDVVYEYLLKGLPRGDYTKISVLLLNYSKLRDQYPMYRDTNTNKLYTAPYVRILIKNRYPKKKKEFKLFLGKY